MKLFLMFTLLFSSLSFADEADKKSKELLKEQVKEQMQREEKYAREQTFYQANNYDFKGSEVNQDSVSNLKEIEVDDFNMDSVYD
ncbi:MAG: hypothetical protein U9N02_05475 [Campylobacterota bacterium]|nr:hypothetical protein [Campylobacterota bacterium]